MLMNEIEKREKAQKILSSEEKSNDLKLYEILQIYKEDLHKSSFCQLYYALLGWKDAHLKELNKEYYQYHRDVDEED